MPSDSFFGTATSPFAAKPKGGLASARLPIDASRTFSSDLLPHIAPTTQTWGEALTRMMPILGDSWGVDDTRQSYKKGDKGTAAVQGGLTALGLGGLGHMVPAMAGIFVGPKGAKNLASFGWNAVEDSQGLAQHLKQKGYDGKHIWERTASETDYPTTLEFPEHVPLTEIDDSRADFKLDDYAKKVIKSTDGEYDNLSLMSLAKDSFPHKEFETAYPWYKDDELRLVPSHVLGGDTAGTREPGITRINRAYMDTAEGRGTMLHELSHGVDEYEGLSNGSNPAYMAQLIANSAEGFASGNEAMVILEIAKQYGVSMDDAVTIWKHRYSNSGLPWNMSMVNHDYRMPAIYTDPSYRDWVLGEASKPRGESFLHEMIDDSMRGVKAAGSWDYKNAYLNTAGEVRARLVDGRKSLKKPTRAAFYPFDMDNPILTGTNKIVDTPLYNQIIRDQKNMYAVSERPETMTHSAAYIVKDPMRPETGGWKLKSEVQRKIEREAKAFNETFKRDMRHFGVTKPSKEDVDAMYRDMGEEPPKQEFKHGGLVKQLTAQECEDLMIGMLEHDASPKFAEGGLVSKSLVDPAKGLFSQMDLIHPKNNQSAPLDIPLNSNNMLAKARAFTPQAHLYRTR